MMKTRIFFLALAALAFFSCSEDDWEDAQQFSDLTGRWVMTRTVSDKPLFDINGDGENSTNILEELPCRRIELILNSDGTFGLLDNTWAFDSNGNTICSSGHTLSEGNWSLNKEFDEINLVFVHEETQWDVHIPFEKNGDQLTCRLGVSFYGYDAEGNQAPIIGTATMERQ